MYIFFSMFLNVLYTLRKAEISGVKCLSCLYIFDIIITLTLLLQLQLEHLWANNYVHKWWF